MGCPETKDERESEIQAISFSGDAPLCVADRHNPLGSGGPATAVRQQCPPR